MTILIDLLNSANNPVAGITSGLLSGLAINGCYLYSGAVSNISGDGQGGGYPQVYGVLYTGHPASGAWGASGTPALYGWMLPALDGVTYETPLQFTGTTTSPPVARAPDFVWPLDANQSGQVKISLAQAPICSGFQIMYWNQVGQLFGGSGANVKLYFFTDGTT